MPSEVNIMQRYDENSAYVYDYNAVCSINLFLNQNFTEDRLSNFWKQVKRSFFKKDHCVWKTNLPFSC